MGAQAKGLEKSSAAFPDLYHEAKMEMRQLAHAHMDASTVGRGIACHATTSALEMKL